MEYLDPIETRVDTPIIVSPCQTLSNSQHNMLRKISIELMNYLNIIGACNLQYAIEPRSDRYFIQQITSRLSDNSLFASKSTGYPLAYISTKLAIGFNLSQLQNYFLAASSACHEPSVDHITIKMQKKNMNNFGSSNDMKRSST
jgi:carbamoylphosphate synthase large subunit